MPMTAHNGVFQNDAAEFVYTRTYARWRDELNRRETWPETVQRYCDFIASERGEKIPPKVLDKIRSAIFKMEAMPSMRALWAAGPAAKAEHVTCYNCSFAPIDSIESFAEGLYILMCGAGFGFSVEQKYVDKLPVVPDRIVHMGLDTHVIDDSRAGWADSLKFLMKSLYGGRDLQMDYSQIRPKGARLKTMGGRASGPEPLVLLHGFVRDIFNKAQGRKLTSLECHDICNQIAEIVVAGGVRRSSEISLSDLLDDAMRDAKSGVYPDRRRMANNSAVYHEKPSAIEFLKEWSALAASGTGERGIFNLVSARAMSPERRLAELIAGTNPCCEILLRLFQFCNLSEVVVRAEDDLDDILEKVETAVWIGAIQSTFTDFGYLRPIWKQNCDEERLLGVSLTGQMDNQAILTASALKAMKARAIKTAKRASAALGINLSAAITCSKPSGTVSQVVNSASGCHARYDRHYIRRYRISSTDPLLHMLRHQGLKAVPEVGQRRKDWEKAKRAEADGGRPYDICGIYRPDRDWNEEMVNTWVVAFPVAAPKGCVTTKDQNAIQQLEWYKKLQQNWCEHNASITVYVQDHEWFEVGNWVYQNWDIVNGVSFLPADNGKYELTPYESITKEEYNEMVKDFPKIDYSQLARFELEDQTSGAQTVACANGICEL